jgi:molybdate transport system substrate-binding protein
MFRQTLAFLLAGFSSPRWVYGLGVIGFLLTSCTLAVERSDPEPLVVSAASNLILAFEELGTLYQQKTGTPVIFNFAASGQLAQQIDQGAPVDLFVAANVGFVEQLAAKGRVLPDSVQIYARGRLTLWTHADSALQVEAVSDLLQPEVRRLAIANPEHAPYGMAARQVLQTAGVWETIQSKLVFGENVRQTLQFAETGDVDVALVPLSLSITSNGHWTLIPEDLHSPIDQALGVVADSPRQAQARDFAALVTGPEGQTILHKYGFALPEEVTSP